MALLQFSDEFDRNRLALPTYSGGDSLGILPYENHGGWTVDPTVGDSGGIHGLIPPSGAFHSAFVLAVGDTDLNIECHFAGDDQGIVVRWTDEDNWVRFVNLDGDARLQECTAGTVTTLLSMGLPNAGTQLHLDVRGDTYNCAVIGTGVGVGSSGSHGPDSVSQQAVFTGHQTATKHGLTSYANTNPIKKLSIKVDQDPPIDIRSTAATSAPSPSSILSLEAPSDVLHNDFLVAFVALNGAGDVAPPSGWTRLIQHTYTSIPATVATMAILTRFWHRGDPTVWSTPTTSRTYVATVTAFGGVDLVTPAPLFYLRNDDYPDNSIYRTHPKWSGRGPFFLGTLALANIDAEPLIPPEPYYGYPGEPGGTELWEERTGGTITNWGWFARGDTETGIGHYGPGVPWATLDGWVSGHLNLEPRPIALNPIRASANPTRVRRRPAGNYVDLVQAGDPTVFWPLDETIMPNGSPQPFTSTTGTASLVEGGLVSYGGTQVMPSTFTPQGGRTAGDAATLRIQRDNISAREPVLYGQYAPPGTYDGTQDFTFECWLRRQDGEIGEGRIDLFMGGIAGTVPDEFRNYGLGFHTWRDVFFSSITEMSATYYYGGTKVEMLAGPADFDVLHHYALRFTAGVGTQMFRDGLPVNALVPIATTTPTGLGPVNIQGDVDLGFVALYQSALTDEQILAHYIAGTATTILGTPHATAHAVHPVELHTPALGTPSAAGHLSELNPSYRPFLGTPATSGHLEVLYPNPAHVPDLGETHTGGHLEVMLAEPVPHLPDLGTSDTAAHVLALAARPITILDGGPGNSAPVGWGRFPIGTPTDVIVIEPHGLLTEDGDLLVAENDDTLIWQ